MTRALIAAACLLALSACHQPLEIARPPADKLRCPDEPGSPAAPGVAVTDAQAGAYMRDLRKAGQACRDDVDWLRDWFAKLPE